MNHNLTLNQINALDIGEGGYFSAYGAAHHGIIAVGDTITRIAEQKVVDLSVVVGTAIPMLFGVNEKKGRLSSIPQSDGFQFGDEGKWDWSSCGFDASENNWVAWGPQVPFYRDGKCPIPEGVEFEVMTIDGGGSLNSARWPHDFQRNDKRIIAFRITGLKEGWIYPREAAKT